MERNVDSLRIIPAFAELPPARLRLVAQAAEEVHFHAGEVIVRQGIRGMRWTRSPRVRPRSGSWTLRKGPCSWRVGEVLSVLSVRIRRERRG
jgi:hypothetical protein